MSSQHDPAGRMTQEAQQLLRSGRIEEAERAFLKVLDVAPLDLQALNIVGLASIRMGQHHRARELFERAVNANPEHAGSQHHFGRALELLGDSAGAVRHYARAAALDANLPAARLHLAVALEKLGDHDAALVQFGRVLADTQAQGKWINSATTPPALLELVQHAVRTFRRGRRQLYERLLAPLEADYGSAELARVGEALRILLGEAKPHYPDTRQLPSFFYFPGLPPQPYLDRSLFGWIDDFEAQTPAIQRELLSLMPEGTGERVFSTTALEDNYLRGTRGAPSWTGHYFYRSGERRTDNCDACPATSRALDALPLSHVPQHGPEVLFSVFTPGTHLLAHRGVTNTRVVAHLPLIIPPDCALRVGGEDHIWQEGRVVVFDDTYEHEAWNHSALTRVVLIFDLWNPHLTEVERLATARIIEAAGDLRAAMDKA